MFGATEYESMWKHDKNNNIQPDLLILDEIEALFDQATCYTNNGTKIETNFDAICNLVKNAKRVIVLDALLSKRSIYFFKAIVRHADIQMFVNDVKLPYTVKLYDEKTHFYEDYDDDIVAGNRTFMFCGGKATAEATYKQITNKLTETNEDFDRDRSLRLITTSTVTKHSS
jgi:hypothetical protein